MARGHFQGFPLPPYPLLYSCSRSPSTDALPYALTHHITLEGVFGRLHIFTTPVALMTLCLRGGVCLSILTLRLGYTAGFGS